MDYSQVRTGRRVLLLIAGVTLLRLLYLAFWCPLDLAPDEAHYWDWSRRLDWSYYSKGPLVAWLIRLGGFLFGDLSRALTGGAMLAVRLPAVLCGGLFLWGVHRLALEAHGNPRWAFALLLVALSLPVVSAGALLMTIDAPYTCAWTWALVFSRRALFGAGGWRAWLMAGTCIALGVLAKHTMVLFVPMLGLFLLARPRFYEPRPNEPHAWKGFCLMAAVGALGGLPILIWNMANGWVTLAHTRGHVSMDGGPALHWAGPVTFVGLQAAILLGYWFLAWAGAMWRYRPGATKDARLGFFWWMSFPMIAFFGLFSLKNGGGEANWPIAGYIAGSVLIVPWLASFLASPSAAVSRATRMSVALVSGAGLALGIAMLDSRPARPVLARLARPVSDAEPTPLRRFDPTCRLKGWHTLAREVDALRGQLRRQGIEPFLAGGHWALPGAIAFYAAEQPIVYCLGSGIGDRHSQYDLWRPNPLADAETFRGATFILVGVAREQAAALFERVDEPRLVTHYEGDDPIAVWHVTVGHGYRGLQRPTASARY